MSNHPFHILHTAIHGMKHADKPIEGAVGGAAIAGTTVPAALAMAGLALTPVGWGVFLGAGAAAGIAYVVNKKKT